MPSRMIANALFPYNVSLIEILIPEWNFYTIRNLIYRYHMCTNNVIIYCTRYSMYSNTPHGIIGRQTSTIHDLVFNLEWSQEKPAYSFQACLLTFLLPTNASAQRSMLSGGDRCIHCRSVARSWSKEMQKARLTFKELNKNV